MGFDTLKSIYYGVWHLWVYVPKNFASLEAYDPKNFVGIEVLKVSICDLNNLRCGDCLSLLIF